MMLAVVPGKEILAEGRVSCSEPKRSGKAGQYLSVLNWLSENGVSLETRGRLINSTSQLSHPFIDTEGMTAPHVLSAGVYWSSTRPMGLRARRAAAVHRTG
jgi:hypothetical protein